MGGEGVVDDEIAAPGRTFTDMLSFSESVALLRDTFDEHGRDPLSPIVQVSVLPERRDNGTLDYEATADKVHTWRAAGATMVVFRPTSYCAAAEKVSQLIDWAVALKAERRRSEAAP